MRGETEQIRHPNFMRQVHAKAAEAARSAGHPDRNKGPQKEFLTFLGLNGDHEEPSKRVTDGRAEVFEKYTAIYGSTIADDLKDAGEREDLKYVVFKRVADLTLQPAEKVH